MPGVHMCTKGIRMVTGLESFPTETATAAGETALSPRDSQECAPPQCVHGLEVLVGHPLVPPASCLLPRGDYLSMASLSEAGKPLSVHLWEHGEVT